MKHIHEIYIYIYLYIFLFAWVRELVISPDFYCTLIIYE